jgi:hypothetical protein
MVMSVTVREVEALKESRKSKPQKTTHHASPIASNSAQITVNNASGFSSDDEIMDCIVVE